MGIPDPPSSFSLLVGTVSQVFSSSIGWVKTVAGTVAGNPLLLIGVVLTFVGLGVGLFRRLLRV